MTRKLLIVLVALLGTTAFAGRYEQSERLPADEELLMRPAAMTGTPELSAETAFMIAMDRAGAVGGQAILHGCEKPPKKVVPYRGNTLRDVLNSIIAADPNYVWRMDNGVVALLPAKGVPDLLKVRISSFDSGDAWSLATAGIYLFALPEVRQRARELGFSQAISGSGLGSIVPGQHPARKVLDIHLQNLTLLEALNALVRSTKRGQWIYDETDCGAEKNFQVQFPE
jgi:hypothetical protein